MPSASKKVIVIFHTPTNAGYAMNALERVFYEVALAFTGARENVYFAFKNLDAGMPGSISVCPENVIAIDAGNMDSLAKAEDFISKSAIQYTFCFDIQPDSPLCKKLRRAGVSRIISYWGSTMSSLNSGLRLFLKRIQVALIRSKPDRFIFESHSMQSYAVNGRGIAREMTAVIPTGVDIEIYRPDNSAGKYVESTFNLPPESQVVFYSGHMEKRKGVHVIVESAITLFDEYPDSPIRYLICGNRPGEENQFLDQIKGTSAEGKVIFGGYRKDLNKIMPGCRLGVVASTGWDSFPMSTLEMAASGLPLVVSQLQGLVETVEEGVTGYMFPPGDHVALAKKILAIVEDDNLHALLSKNAVNRIHNKYTTTHQFNHLLEEFKKTFV